jgi:glutathione-independent formaldehyde dehydrogenase
VFGIRAPATILVWASTESEWVAVPVGLLASYSAMIRGASKVMIVDRHPDRLALAESVGVIAIDDSKNDPVEVVKELTNGQGADCGCECVGWQAHDPNGHEHPNDTMNKLVASVRATGRIGVVGVFPEEDPRGPDKLMQKGQIAFDFGAFFGKGLRMGSGQCDVKRYNRRLRDLIHAGRAQPSFIVSHHLPLDQAPAAYEQFDKRTKVILRPSG